MHKQLSRAKETILKVSAWVKKLEQNHIIHKGGFRLAEIGKNNIVRYMKVTLFIV